MDLHDGLDAGGEHGRGKPPRFESEHGAAASGDGTAGSGDYDAPGGYDDAGGDSGPDSGTGDDGPDDSGTMTVDMGGETRELPAERDYTGDGRPDAATETPDGRVIIFADTEDNQTGAATPDGRADEAYVVDKQTGRVVRTAHVDPRTGDWVEGADTEGSTAAASGGTADPGDPGAVSADPGDPAVSADPGAAGGPGDGTDGTGNPSGGTGGTGGSGTMTVDMGGETRELPAERDYTGDGRPDAATETPDGRVIIFADTEDNQTGAATPDGRADEAYVVDKQTGRVVRTAHVDPRTGDWVEGADTGGSPAAPSSTGGNEVDS